MPKYNDQELNQWRDTGALFTTTTNEQIQPLLEQIQHKHQEEAHIMFILLWLSAARPNEILNLKRTDLKKIGNHLQIIFPASKGSQAGAFRFPLTSPLIKKVWDFASKKWEWELMFPHFYCDRKMTHTTKVWYKKDKVTGENVRYFKRYDKAYDHSAHHIGYWFKKWGLRTPYYYRHNRLTIAAEYLPIRELQRLKRAKKEDSVYIYLRSTAESQAKLTKVMLK